MFQDESEVIITGSSATELGGSNLLPLFRLTIDKSSNDVQMQGILEIADNLNMVDGNLDMNGFNIHLASGRLQNEAPGHEVFSSVAGGKLSRTVSYNGVVAADSGKLGIEISSPSNLGLVTITRSHDAQFVGSGNGIQRYYQVKTTNPPGNNTTIRFYYHDSELNGVIESDLALFQSTDDGVSWVPHGYSSRNATQNFVEVRNLNPDGRWTLNNSSSFPVEWLDFVAIPKGKQVHCQWATASETNTAYFEVERSLDGMSFEGVVRTNAAGNSQQVQEYEAFDKKPLLGASYYRIKQVDIDGSFSYSPQVNVFFSQESRLSVFPNPTKEQSRLNLSLQESSPCQN